MSFRGGGASDKLTLKGKRQGFTLKKLVERKNILTKKCQVAFTLAEVLITLGIIGIVASMTLPALIHKNQNKALEAALKKNYSAISQALDMYQAQTGERIKAGEIEGRMLKTVLMKYLKSVRDCGPSFIENVCIEDYESSPKRYKTFNNTQYFRQNLLDDGVFVLPDGSTVILENSNVNVNSGSIYISALM
ncbi:hypothetical protein DBY21_02990 [Candidatus Gastranaerophilales bacterium]|nr:MAG: hypothetical protein DBY21_02990 [Candidatus Gastranaerophilales bacterium]